MGRWRPPRKVGSPYITAGGYLALQEELKGIWVLRRDVVAALAAAAAEGDRSENAEYIYRKKELGGLDRRIRYLQKRLPKLQVVRHKVAPEQVFFGAEVTLVSADNETLRYIVVGEDEANASAGKINIDSPLAQALLKKRVGDDVSIDSGERRLVATVESIAYDTEES